MYNLFDHNIPPSFSTITRKLWKIWKIKFEDGPEESYDHKVVAR